MFKRAIPIFAVPLAIASSSSPLIRDNISTRVLKCHAPTVVRSGWFLLKEINRRVRLTREELDTSDRGRLTAARCYRPVMIRVILFRRTEEVSGLRNHRTRLWPGVLLAAAVVGYLLLPVVRAAPGAAGQAEGTIAAVDTGAVTVATRTGSQVRIVVTGNTVVIQRKLSKLEDIKPNDFVGVTARREADGSLTAISINIFPPPVQGPGARRAVRDGHREYHDQCNGLSERAPD